jgi:dTMP kinase
MQKGKFIVFEGIDGSGKSTQIQLLKDRLTKQNMKVYCTMEPSERPIGKLIRKILQKKIITTRDALAGLYMSDRLDHLNNDEDGIMKKLNAGITVICDRYYMSSLAYNSIGTSIDWVYMLNEKCMNILRPDITIYLELSVKESLDRIANGRDQSELFEKKEILELVKDNYKEAMKRLAPFEKISILKAAGDPEWIHANILKEVENIL